MSQILKAKHTLIGKSLLPVILTMKSSGSAIEIVEFNRLKRDHPLEAYSLPELRLEFEKLTGESVKDVVALIGKDESTETLRYLVHHAIGHANLVGAPKGQLLEQQPNTSKSTNGCVTGISEVRVKKMEESLVSLKSKQAGDRVEEALKNVRVLAGRPKLTSPSVLLASLEVLVENAAKAGHNETAYFTKAQQTCRQYEDNVDKCSLCLKLLGSSEDKKISSIVADWAKAKKYENNKNDQGLQKENKTAQPVNQFTCMSGFPYPLFPFNFPFISPYIPPGSSMMPQHFNMGRPFIRPRMQRSKRESGHYVNDCPKKFQPVIPDWELNAGFQPIGIETVNSSEWVNYRGEVLEPPFVYISAEDAADGKDFDFSTLPFRNPAMFKAVNGVRVQNYFKHFSGTFKSKHYDAPSPPCVYFPNATNCKQFTTFIVKTLLDRLANGSMSIWGKVGECSPPHLIMPLTVEPTKPQVPRLVSHRCFMSSVDDKSGYDHILLHDDSKTYFGVEFGGWYLVFKTIQFGYKTSAYIYNTTGLQASSYCRKLGVPCLQYIDDRLISEFTHRFNCDTGDLFASAKRSLYIFCEVLVRLGYFIGLEKSVFEPSQSILFLGMVTDSIKQCFLLPDKNKKHFACLRDAILSNSSVDLKTLQRFAGKCISFLLALPTAKLYTREVNMAIGQAVKNGKSVAVSGDLKSEIEHWRLLDDWEGYVPWRKEKHLQINIATDASLFR
ncbi:hypothetical protein KUTeg_021585 [Tegillarca granosa]|uniref:Reverse transcriptase domain-containing protein n=1 Tax=Tegillarca granosa TaxID=220873 RepID=A0ABQ9E3Q2_TEGGR|nr:hypothetical protein KUTeg_021585 [Tegillarca granosa]